MIHMTAANASTGVEEDDDEFDDDEETDGFVDTRDDFSDSVCFFRFSSELHQLPLLVPLVEVDIGPFVVTLVVEVVTEVATNAPVEVVAAFIGPFVRMLTEPLVR